MHKQRTKLFDPNQKGFIRGIDGCLEHSNMITEVICDANRKQKDVYITSIDLNDVFGSLTHKYIMYMLSRMNFPQSIENIIKDSYVNGVTKIRVGNDESDLININKVVKQGCPLSSLIFNFCINPLLSKLEQIVRWLFKHIPMTLCSLHLQEKACR